MRLVYFFHAKNYKDLRKGLIDYLISTENITLTFGSKLEKLTTICKWLPEFVECA